MSETPAGSARPDSARQPIWSRPDRGTRGPVPGHSRAAIVAAAVALADSGGLAAVSMRAVAGALGTGAGSLYRYLASRDDLLDLMIDTVVAELRPYPAGSGKWMDELLLLAGRQLALYRRHPWLLEVIQRRSAPGPHTLDYFDNCLRIMTPLRCGTTAKFEAVAMITGVVSLFARSATASGPYFLDGVDPKAHPHLTAALNEPASPASQSDLFERTVRGLLTGLLTP